MPHCWLLAAAPTQEHIRDYFWLQQSFLPLLTTAPAGDKQQQQQVKGGLHNLASSSELLGTMSFNGPC